MDARLIGKIDPESSSLRFPLKPLKFARKRGVAGALQLLHRDLFVNAIDLNDSDGIASKGIFNEAILRWRYCIIFVVIQPRDFKTSSLLGMLGWKMIVIGNEITGLVRQQTQHEDGSLGFIESIRRG